MERQNGIKESKYSSQAYEVLDGLLYLPTTKRSFVLYFGYDMVDLSPIFNKSIIQEWTSEMFDINFVTPFESSSTNSLSESRLLSVINFHVAISKNSSLIPSMKHLLQSLLKLINLYAIKSTFNKVQREFILSLLTSMSLDIRCAFLHPLVKEIKDKINFNGMIYFFIIYFCTFLNCYQPFSGAEYNNLAYSIVLDKIYRIKTSYIASFNEIIIFEKVLEYCLNYMLEMLNKPNGLTALDQFSNENRNWPKVFLYLTVNQSNCEYSVRLMMLFDKIFEVANKHFHDELADNLLISLISLRSMNISKLKSCLFFFILDYKNSKNSLWDVPITTNLIDELEHDSENDKFSLFFDESKTIRDDWFPPVYNSGNLNFKIFPKIFY